MNEVSLILLVVSWCISWAAVVINLVLGYIAKRQVTVRESVGVFGALFLFGLIVSKIAINGLSPGLIIQ